MPSLLWLEEVIYVWNIVSFTQIHRRRYQPIQQFSVKGKSQCNSLRLIAEDLATTHLVRLTRLSQGYGSYG